MKLPLSWLKEYIALDEAPAAFAERLTLAGLEVDGIEPAPLSFSGVVVAEILEIEPHPDADRLKVTQVSDGSETLQIVTAATNCRVGMRTALAKSGARLDNGAFKIKRGKMRGIQSDGMFCGLSDLGLGPETGGIAEFGDEMAIGEELATHYGDQIIEISLTPNLGHCQSLLGIARELAALTGAELHPPATKLTESDQRVQVEIAVEEGEGCPRYAARVIEGLKIAPSPSWLARRLEGCGQRSINNVVDATNLVMLELGQPLHAFDLEKVAGEKIVVRGAREGEKLTTLDGEERQLDVGTLLICDGEKPIALAGVMGGANSEVGDETTTILIEAAHFAMSAIRASSKSLGLQTEASRRFERGVDPNLVLRALDRVAALIVEVAGGSIRKGVVEVGQVAARRKETMRISRANKLLGTTFSQNEVIELLRRLDFKTKPAGDNELLVDVPTYRFDVAAEIDLIEEVGRLYGYQNIPRKAANYSTSHLPHTPLYLFEGEVRQRLVGAGLQEMMSSSLIGAGDAEAIPLERDRWVELMGGQMILAPSLLPSLLRAVARNQNHGTRDIAAFEIGRVHFKDGSEYQEQPMVAMVLAGSATVPHWDGEDREVDFFDLKGLVERLTLAKLKPSKLDLFHPKRQAMAVVDKMELGALGELHPALLRHFGIEGRLYFAALNLYDLMASATELPQGAPLPLYPGSQRDWTLTVTEGTSHENLMEAISATPSRLLKKVSIVAIYRSASLGDGWKNVTYRFTYRDDRKTVAMKAVEQEHTRITNGVVATLGSNVRGES